MLYEVITPVHRNLLTAAYGKRFQFLASHHRSEARPSCDASFVGYNPGYQGKSLATDADAGDLNAFVSQLAFDDLLGFESIFSPKLRCVFDLDLIVSDMDPHRRFGSAGKKYA